MKRLAATVLAVILACGGIISGSFAEGEETYQYQVRQDGTAEIVSAGRELTEAVIPAELDGYRVTAIGRNAFSGAGLYNKHVTVPASVQKMSLERFPMNPTFRVIPGSTAQWYCDNQMLRYELVEPET